MVDLAIHIVAFVIVALAGFFCLALIFHLALWVIIGISATVTGIWEFFVWICELFGKVLLDIWGLFVWIYKRVTR